LDDQSINSNSTEQLLISQDQESLSSRYRLFIISGFTRVVLTRILSLIYIVVVARIVSLSVQDHLILLSTGQWIVGVVSTFGFTFSLTRMAFTEENRSHVVASGVTSVLLLGTIITIILNLIFAILTGLDLIEILLYLFSCVLYFILQIALLVEDTRLRSDRKQLATALFSIANSILVPSLFFIFETLTSVLVSWILGLLLTLFYERKVIYISFSNLKWDYKTSKAIFFYGLPIYMSSLFTAVVQNLDRFILFIRFPEGDLAEYYWAFRISITFEEIFLVLLTGAFPLLTKLYKNNDMAVFEIRTQSILKIGLFLGLFLYGVVFHQANVITLLILGNKFLGVIIILQILTVATTVKIVRNILFQVVLAEGRRRYITESVVFGALSRIIFILILIPFGGVGFAFALLLQSIVLSLYFIFRKKKTTMNSLIHLRVILSLIIIVMFTFIFSSPLGLILSIIKGCFYIIGFLFILFILKPFNNDDYVLFERLAGKKFQIFLPIVSLFTK
jgi:O-antigen/teichoic acid export membrane protein